MLILCHFVISLAGLIYAANNENINQGSSSDEVVTDGQSNNNLPNFAIDLYKSSLDSNNNLPNVAIDLYKSSLDSNANDNTVMCPLSVALGLVLLLEGATGETQQKIRNVLATADPGADVLGHYQQLLHQLKINTDTVKLLIAAGMFIDEHFSLNQTYKSIMSENYESHIENADFEGNLDESRQTINNWVNQSTMGKIPELFKSGDLSKDIQLVLTNAVYFKASWQNRFTLLDEMQSFTNFDNQQVQTEFISGNALSMDIGNLNTIQIQYENGIFSMFIFLPSENSNLTAFENDLNGQKIGDLISPFAIDNNENIQPVKVELPKFDIRSSMNLQNSLKKLGLGELFDDANLNGISETPLKLSKALHEAFITVDEHGTEAAAATGTSATTRALALFPTVTVNRPFLYAIVHKDTAGIIFMGKVNSISASGTSTRSGKVSIENNMLNEVEPLSMSALPAYTL